MLVGIGANASLYGFYLLLTANAVPPKTAMTIAYVLGTALTFTFNRLWTFEQRSDAAASLARYVTVYMMGYVVNFAVLAFLVDRMGYRHEYVQACMVVLLAFFIFVLQKFWVFRQSQSSTP